MIDAIEYERIQWHVEDFPDEYSGNQLWRLRAHGIVYFSVRIFASLPELS